MIEVFLNVNLCQKRIKDSNLNMIKYLYLKVLNECKYVIFLSTLLVCLGVCVFVSNKRQTAEPIRPNFFVGHHNTPTKVYERSKLRSIASNKIRFP